MNNYIYWIFYTGLSLQLILILTQGNLKKIEDIFQSFLGNFLVFIYTYMITSDFKFSIFFNMFGYFISLYKK
jgi:hypothetical protein